MRNNKVIGKDWKYTYAAPRRIDNLYAGGSDFPQYRGPHFGDKGYYITLTNGKFEVKRVISECITAIEK